MGLTIHYSGRINKEASLIDLIDEVRDISEIYNWPYHIYENKFPKESFDFLDHDGKIYGISFIPPKCETVNICFLSNGTMSSLPNLNVWGNSDNEEEKKYLYMISVKTQFAGSSIHKLLVHLLKYLSKKYFDEFKVFDEGKYWETNDELLLGEIFERYNYYLDAFGEALENIPKLDGENFEDYFLRIMEKIKQQKKDDTL
jgi:hypothetical protein